VVRVEFRVLGAVEIRRGGQVVPIGGPQQRAVAAVLILNANRAVSSDELTEALWQEHPPATAGHLLHVLVSRLRKALHEDGDPSRQVLVTQAPGYLLRVLPGELDLQRFEDAGADGHRALLAGDYPGAIARCEEALDEWRGPPLQEFRYSAFAETHVRRLHEMRQQIVSDRIAAELALGRHAQLVREIRGLLEEDPLREPLWGQLMLALYRSGRQAEALAAYGEAYSLLGDELGIEPGPELKALQVQILQQDETLRLSKPEVRPLPPDGAESPAGGGREGPIRVEPVPLDRRPSGIRRLVGRRPAMVIVLATVALIALVAVLLVPVEGRGGQAHGTVAVRPDSVARIDAGSNRIVWDSRVGAGPRAVAVYQGHAWVANFDDRTVTQLGPTVDSPERSMGDVGIPAALAAGGGSVWVADPFNGSLYQLNAQKGSVSRVVQDLGGPMAVAVGFGSVWVADFLGNRLLRISPGSGRVVAQIPLGDQAGPAGVVVGGGSVWVIDQLAHAVSKVDPLDNRVVAARIELCCTPDSATFGGGSLWVTSGQGRSLMRVDPSTDAVGRTIPVACNAPLGVAWAAGSLWVTCPQDKTLLRLDQEGTVLDTKHLGAPTGSVAASNGTVWVAVGTA
jgi:DNA-binding SARP family transcriptional activator/streptogramin lyase